MNDLRRVLGLVTVLSGCAALGACSAAAPNGTALIGDADAAVGAVSEGDDADENDLTEPDANENRDVGKKDAGKHDAAAIDAGKKDAGKHDAATIDAGELDADDGIDAATPDTGTVGSVGGTTVAECQGQAALAANFNGATPTVTSGFAIYAGGQNEVYAYSRAAVTDYAYRGQAGETKVRLLLPHVTGPGQYQGMMGVFAWDASQGKWVNYATPTQTVVVTIASASVVMPTGRMCNGWFVGRAEALFSPNNVVVLDFSVPLLTPSFPHSKPGPP